MSSPCDVDTEELKNDDSTTVPLMWIWSRSLVGFLRATTNSFALLTLRVRSLFWHHNATSLGYQADNRGVVRKLDDGVDVAQSHAVVG